MAKRIATQLADEIDTAIANAHAESLDAIELDITAARRWLQWAKKLDARMRLDGSKQNKKRKPAKA